MEGGVTVGGEGGHDGLTALQEQQRGVGPVGEWGGTSVIPHGFTGLLLDLIQP